MNLRRLKRIFLVIEYTEDNLNFSPEEYSFSLTLLQQRYNNIIITYLVFYTQQVRILHNLIGESLYADKIK